MIIKDEDYRSFAALNFSGMKILLKSPAHYRWSIDNPTKETKALRIGTMSHAAALQPEVFKNYVAGPDVNRTTKIGKEAWQQFVDSLQPGQIVSDPDEVALATKIGDRFRELVASVGCEGFQYVETGFATDYADILFKCKIDAFGTDGYIYDLKTTEDASPKAFLREILNYKLNLQALLYRTLFEREFKTRPLGFRLVVIEKTEPYFGAVYTMGPELMHRAMLDLEECIKTFSKCTTANAWPAYESNSLLDLPKTESKSLTF